MEYDPELKMELVNAEILLQDLKKIEVYLSLQLEELNVKPLLLTHEKTVFYFSIFHPTE